MSIPSIRAYALPAQASLPANRVNWELQPQRAVLLIHDMQDYFLRYYGEASPLVAELLAHIRAMRDWADEHGVPVLYTAQPARQSGADRALLNDMWGPGLSGADPALQSIAETLAPRADDVVLTKWRYSAFQRSPLQQRMSDWGRDQLLITGIYAHIGCMTTALDAFMRDIQPFFLADATADFSESEHRMALEYVAGRCGVVLSCEQARQAASAPFGEDWLRRELRPYLDAEAVGLLPDDNLMDYGLNSVQLMQLIGNWQRHGLRLRFEELAEQPSLRTWQALIQQRRAA